MTEAVPEDAFLACARAGLCHVKGMIAFLRGTVAESYPQRLILDVHGVGYEVIVPLSTFDRLNPLPGRELTLKTYLHVRENMQVLYGFATDAERDIFLLLIERVSGIGPATAIAILGSLSVEQFKQAVVGGDVSGIARAKGVGKKTAERIVLELKDKVGLAATWEAQAQGATSQAAGDAELALIALGFKQVEPSGCRRGRADTRRFAFHELKELPEEGRCFCKFLIFMREHVRLAECSLFAEAGGTYCHDGGTIVLTAG